MEAGEGNIEEARGIFARGAQGSPHAPLLIAWAELEEGNGRHAPCPATSVIHSHSLCRNTEVKQPCSQALCKPPFFLHSELKPKLQQWIPVSHILSLLTLV